MKTFINDDRGVSSVLIVIMMIVLMVFGLAGLTLAMSNGRLADKKIDWLSDYYLLEGEANRVIAQIDTTLSNTTDNDNIQALIANLGNDLDLDISTKQDNAVHIISFTVEKNAEYPKYIDVVLAVTKDAQGDYSIKTERFMQHQAPFEYGSLFQFD